MSGALKLRWACLQWATVHGIHWLELHTHGGTKRKEQKWNNIKPSIHTLDDKNVSRLPQSFLSHPNYLRSMD
jgi:hypothetical protein